MRLLLYQIVSVFLFAGFFQDMYCEDNLWYRDGLLDRSEGIRAIQLYRTTSNSTSLHSTNAKFMEGGGPEGYVILPKIAIGQESLYPEMKVFVRVCYKLGSFQQMMHTFY